jgi:hypothetical protein
MEILLTVISNFSEFAKEKVKVTMRVWLQMQHVQTSSLESETMVSNISIEVYVELVIVSDF